MALNLGELFFQLGAKTDGLQRAEKEARRFAENTEKHFNSVSNSAKKLGGAIVAIISVEAIRRTIMLADHYRSLEQRLKTATKATGDYVRVSEEVFKISNENGTSLETNVALFQSLARVAPEIGATTTQILKLTKEVGQLGVIGGSSSEEMKYGLLQFTQGLASGVLHAEEMNSILENLPEVANRIAKGMGMTVGQFRQAVLNGKVLSSDVFDSLIKQAPEVAKEFESIPPTIDRSWNALQNSFMKFIGQIDQATGATQGLATEMQKVADYLGGDFSESIDDVVEVFQEIGDYIAVWNDMLNDVGVSFGEIGDSAGGVVSALWEAVKFVGKALLELPINLKVIWTIFIEHIDQARAKGEAIAKDLNVSFEMTWEVIKQAGASAAYYVEIAWAKMSDAVVGFFGDAIGGIGSALESIPMIGDKFSGVSEFANELKAMATSEIYFNNAMAKGNAIRAKKMEALRAEHTQIEANKKAELQASNDRIWSALMERDATLKGIADKAKARELERQEERKARAEKEASMKAEIQATESQQKKLAELHKKQAVEANQRQSLQPRFNALVNSLSTETELENRHYQDSLNDLKQAEDLKIQSVLSYHEMRERLEEQHQNRLRDITANYSENRRKIDAIGGALGIDLAKRAGDLTLKEQGQTFKNQIDQASQYSKEFFELKKALAMATALIDGPKAILSSYSFGAELGGPVLGAVFAGIAAAATAVQIAGIASAQYQGGKAVGGNVFAGGLYKVNEHGTEMLTVGGDDYLMMGNQSGKITPNNKLKAGSGGGVVVNVYPQSGETAKVNSRETKDGMQIDVIIEKIQQKIADGISRGGSPVSDSMESQYGLNRSAGALS